MKIETISLYRSEIELICDALREYERGTREFYCDYPEDYDEVFITRIRKCSEVFSLISDNSSVKIEVSE